jgi:hypothetical protein
VADATHQDHVQAEVVGRNTVCYRGIIVTILIVGLSLYHTDDALSWNHDDVLERKCLSLVDQASS